MKHTTELLKYSDDHHHCASIAFGDISPCLGKDTVFVCYHGKECTDNQRVHICVYNEPATVWYNIDLEDKTGNPIVWNQDGKMLIFYSKFSDTDKEGNPVEMPRGPVERWKYCENYLAEIIINNNKIELKNKTKIDDAFGLLARCQPLKVKDKMLIPLYREKDPICEIWEYDNGLKKLSEFGDDPNIMSENGLSPHYLGNGVAIQPTLVEVNNILYAFCRNVCRGQDDRRKAWTTASIDGGKTWNPIKASGIPNHNNSLVATNKNETDCFLVINYTPTRNDIVLYDTGTKNQISLATPIAGERMSFSYPNLAWDSYNLHIVHTNCGVIAWHRFDKEFLNEAFKART